MSGEEIPSSSTYAHEIVIVCRKEKVPCIQPLSLGVVRYLLQCDTNGIRMGIGSTERRRRGNVQCRRRIICSRLLIQFNSTTTSSSHCQWLGNKIHPLASQLGVSYRRWRNYTGNLSQLLPHTVLVEIKINGTD